MANETSFEKVMNACLEAKKTPTAKKAIKESVKKTAKKPAKKISESKKAVKSKRVTESEDDELIDDVDVDIPAIPDVDDIEVDEIEVADDTMDDVADDIMVVVDPELDAEDIDAVASELQDIIDDTEEGEVPTTDEYVGDFTYGCPVCGTTFFSADEMGDGDECPVCGNTPNGFVLVGQVASTSDEEEEIPMDDEIIDDFADEEEIPADDEELVADIEDEEEEEEIADLESLRRARRVASRKAEARNAMARRNAVRKTANRKVAERKVAPRKATGFQLDESTFNPFMTKFIRENYKNAKSFRMISATRYKDTNTLKVECLITMKSGAKKKSILKVEGFNPNSKVMLAKDVSRTFKSESKSAPFRFTVRKVGNTIKCEGLRYNYITKSLKEGARLQVSGNLIRENKNVNRAPQRRVAESRANVARRHSTNRGRFSK